MDKDLTSIQEDFFRTLESLHPSERLQRHIEAAKDDLRTGNHEVEVVRGESRVTGFTLNDK